MYNGGYSPSLRQGFDPSTTIKSQKLQGLGLFVGGGNYDRGLEDGGAIEMKWANDISPNAIHTYMVKSDSDSCKPYLGSIDDLFHAALTGSNKVPLPGDVQFISGGSPCQGFSRLTRDKETDQQSKNRSLIASFASFIDLYSPCYGFLENVSSIVQAKRRGSNASSRSLSVQWLVYVTKCASRGWMLGHLGHRSRAPASSSASLYLVSRCSSHQFHLTRTLQ